VDGLLILGEVQVLTQGEVVVDGVLILGEVQVVADGVWRPPEVKLASHHLPNPEPSFHPDNIK
jgi:hypothetical protein